MSRTVETQDYPDFLLVVNSLPRKFVVFYYPNGTGLGLHAWAVATDMQALVQLNTSTDAPSFTTDFPSAIQLPGVPVFS